MQDRMAMTHEFALALDSELCRPSSQRPGAAHRPWLDSLNEATRRQRQHYKFLRGSWNLSAYAQRKLSWLRASCPVANLGPDGTIGFGELTGSDAEPYFSVFMQEPVPTPDSCPYPLSFALLEALEEDVLSRRGGREVALEGGGHDVRRPRAGAAALVRAARISRASGEVRGGLAKDRPLRPFSVVRCPPRRGAQGGSLIGRCGERQAAYCRAAMPSRRSWRRG